MTRHLRELWRGRVIPKRDERCLGADDALVSAAISESAN